ncbi:1,4-dihydroxy-6-naphthoate synthase [Roseiconus lacunae]|uniref:1,4-dihydroxy-6-naphthoate synthase n=1 Tax=Roseiconus lacunae TaxID=2605694 RepID=UPI0011F0AF22|nr:1,4-dihydroxy-6-naphthoate synthase [Roseiconus lacunae]
MNTPIRLGISTCPNDTFAFHAILEQKVDHRGLEFEIELLDIQQLNDRLFAGDFDVAKCSFHAALLLAEQMTVLPSGSALGFGVGPLLLSAHTGKHGPTTSPDAAPTPETPGMLTLCPGQQTTATMLLKLFYPAASKLEQVVFSDIMPKLQNATADFGVCIHEGRFTWQEQGLALVEDLGARWESETKAPLPLGGLVANKTLPSDVLRNVQATVRDSLLYARTNPDRAIPTMRKYAQEFDDDVLMKHVDLYVNDWTVDLGEVGRNALDELNRRAVTAGLIASSAPRLDILPG